MDNKEKEIEQNIHYLEKHKFQKTLPELIKRLKGRRVIIYGAGMLFNLIKEHYDLTGLNIVGITDKKFESSSDDKYEDYKIYKLNEITKSDADCILVSTKFYLSIIENLYGKFKNSGIKILPLVKKSFFTLLKEL